MPCVGKLWNACCRQKAIDSSAIKTTTLSKCLTTVDLLAIGISSTLGAGIYVLTGEVAKSTAGPGIVLSFTIAAIASILSGLCYIEFATRVPKAGSAYIYSYVTIGEFVAFVIGWNLILEYSIGAASVSRAFSSYVDSLFGDVMKNETAKLVGEINIYGLSSNLDFFVFGVVIILTIIIALGVKNSVRLNNMLTFINIVVVFAIIVIGLFYVKKENWSNFAPFGFKGIVAGASTCFFAFIGFDVIATTAEEAKNPGKSIPVGIVGTICICLTAYVGVSTVITLMVPYNKLQSESAVADAFRQQGAVYVRYIVGVGAGLSLLGCTVSSMFPLPRLLYAMAQDGMIIPVFSRVSSKTEVPVAGTIISGVFTGLLAMILNLHDLVEMLSIGTLLAYTIVVICVLILRYETETVGLSSNEGTVEEGTEASTGLIICDTESDDESVTLQVTDNQAKSRLEERTPLVNEELQGKIKTRKTMVSLALLGIIVGLTGICSLLVFKSNALKRPQIWIPLLILVVALVGSSIFLSRQPQNPQKLWFKVPLVPWIPILGLFFNIYLILELKPLTWVRFVVWMSIGLVIYFSYSMWHSTARIDVRSCTPDTEAYVPLTKFENKTNGKASKED